MSEPGPEHPVRQQHRPPFPAQEIEHPGYTDRMEPRPDHGEDSYRGTGRLSDRRHRRHAVSLSGEEPRTVRERFTGRGR